MKKNKMTKLALALGTVATIAAPIAAVVSCGGIGETAGRYNTAERNEIELDTTFASTGPQFKTLDALVSKYNSLAVADQPANYKKVNLVHVEGGYGTIPSQLKVKFLSKTNEIPNMFIDYADAAGRIAWDGMDLDLKDAKGQLDSNIFDSINKNIGGIAKGEDVILPIAQSAEMMTINGPLLNFLVKAAGGDFDGEIATKINAAIKGSTDFPADAATNSQGWKGKGEAGQITSFKVKDSDFESYESLFALSKKLAKSQGLNDKATKRILGLDSGPNALYEMAFSGAKGIDKDFIYSKNQDKGYVNYDLFDNKAQTTLFKDTLKEITDSVSSGSTKIYGGGAYASSDTTYHQVAMSIGSTAGYSHNFVKAEQKPTIDGKTPFSGYTSKILKGEATFNSSGHDNKITDKPGKYDFGVDTASLAAAKAFLTTNTNNVYLVKGDKLPTGVIAATKKVELKDKTGTRGFLVVASDTKVDGAKTTLQENEMVTIPAPASDKAAGTKVAFLQGPGLIGVHNNANDDKATVAFAKWFTSVAKTNVKLPFAKSATDFDSPLAAWAQGSEYAVSVEGKVLGGEEVLSAATAYTKGNFYVTQLIKKIDAKKATLLSPAADDKSGVLRTELESVLKTSYSDYHGGGKLNSDTIYGNLRNTAVIDNIVE